MKKLLVLMSLLWLNSCVTYEKCVDKFGSGQDSVQVAAVIKAEIKGDTTIFQFTNKMLDAMPVDAVLSTTHNGVKSSLRKFSASDFACEAETLTKLIEKEVKVPCPPVHYFKPDPEIVEVTPFWCPTVIGLLILLLLAQTARVWLLKMDLDYPTHKLPV